MKSVLVFIFLLPLISVAQKDYSINDLKNGKNINDSSFIYTLPFEYKKKYC